MEAALIIYIHVYTGGTIVHSRVSLTQVYCGLKNGKIVSMKIDLSRYYKCKVCMNYHMEN